MSEQKVMFEAIEAGPHGLDGARPPLDLEAAGYSDVEYRATGSARRYTTHARPEHGMWDWAASPHEAPFTTRVLVRAPASDKASGVVFVEWLNVSSGRDAAPGWAYLGEHLVREGHAWVGVSAQFNGVMGGVASVDPEAGATPGLAATDPRYDGMDHPGDAYSYDLFTRVASALTDTGAPLDGFADPTILAIGQSQSAFALTSYYNGVHLQTDVFDGFLIHCRGGASAPIGDAGAGFDMVAMAAGDPVRLRTDLRTPVMVVQTETELGGHLRFLPARQVDHDRLRTWEIAGASHADKWLIGDFEEVLGCEGPVNAGQQVYVLRAAAEGLVSWVRDGRAPRSHPPLKTVSSTDPTLQVGEVTENALGGVRTPAVEAPRRRLSGVSRPGASRMCRLFGSTDPLPEVALEKLWVDDEAYESSYRAAVDEAVRGGVVLEADREAVLAEM